MYNICIDGRYIYPYMDGIGRYLFNLIDNISRITLTQKELRFHILEIDKFSEKSILRNLDGRANLNFIKIPVQPQTFQNHFISKYINKYKFDLFHYGQFNLPWFINIPSITTIHDLNPQKFPDFFDTKFEKLKSKYAIFSNWVSIVKSQYIIAISNSTKRDLLDLYGEKYAKKIKVIYEGVDERYLNLHDKENYIKRLLELKEEHRLNEYLLYVGNNRPHKNLNKILLAFKRLKNVHNISHKLVLVGRHYANRFTDVRKIAEELNIESDISLIECGDNDLISFYLGATCLIACSFSEGFGLPILEAMALGTPVVTSNVSAMKEIATGSAILVNPNSESDIADGIHKIISDNKKRMEIISKGIKTAAFFQWDKTAEKTLNLYLEFFNKSNNRIY